MSKEEKHTLVDEAVLARAARAREHRAKSWGLGLGVLRGSVPAPGAALSSTSEPSRAATVRVALPRAT